MSRQELDRIKLLEELKSERINYTEAAEILGVSLRQLYRIYKRYLEQGETGIIHKLRGKKSNRGYSKEIKSKVISLYRSRYNDYGPTLFREKLIEYHNLKISKETLRQWMRSEAITTGNRQKRPHRKRRERRSGMGELLQFDGSPHDWFEGRGPECCLLHAVDDATSRVYLKFAPSENSSDAMQTMWEYVMLYGAPRQLYTDRGSVFYAEKQLTDFSRAMEELGCQMIFARSPQAKGRVERGNKTFQDRLVKAMRERGISGIGEANKYLREEFIGSHNERFALNNQVADVHYSVEGKNLQNIFCYKTERQVRNDYTITLDAVYLQLNNSATPLPLPRKMIQVHKWLDGSLHLYYKDNELAYEILKAKPGRAIPQIRKPRTDHPWRGMNKKLKQTFSQNIKNKKSEEVPQKIAIHSKVKTKHRVQHVSV